MKKLIALLLAFIMAFSLIACSSTEAPEKDPVNGTTPAEDKPAADASAENELVTLKWVAGANSVPDTTEVELVLAEANKILNEKIGVNLEIEFMTFTEISEKMPMYMASDMPWDLCFTSNWANIYKDAATKGGLLKLNDLLDTVATDLKSTLPEYFWEGAALNGEIYAVPNMQIVASSMCWVIQTEYAEKYGLDTTSVKNLTDFEAFFQKIVDNEPGLYPYRAHSGIRGFYDNAEKMLVEASLGNSLSAHSGMGAIRVLTDGELNFSADAGMDEIISAQKKMREWMDKGYIRADYLSTIEDDGADKTALKFVVWDDNYKPGVETEFENQYGIDVTVIPCTVPVINSGSLTATMTGINAKTEHPEKAIQLIELMNTDAELYNLLCYGIEGRHYTLTENGQMIPNTESGYYLNSDWAMGNTNLGMTMDGQPLDMREQVVEMNETGYVSRLSGFAFDSTAVEVELAAVNEITSQYGNQFLTTSDIDAFNADLMEQYKNAGIDKIADEANRQLQEFLAG